jgi:hypothetical protein
VLNCACLQDATAYAVPVSLLAELGQRWPGWYRGLYEEFTDRAVATFGKIELLTLHTLDVRLAVYLLRMARLRGSIAADGSWSVPIAENQSEIAARVGGTRQFINAFLKRWANRGVIELGKDHIRILDVAALGRQVDTEGSAGDGVDRRRRIARRVDALAFREADLPGRGSDPRVRLGGNMREPAPAADEFEQGRVGHGRHSTGPAAGVLKVTEPDRDAA